MYQKTTLDNGLRILTATMPHTRSVSINIFIGIGSRYETEPEAGISHFIEHLCFKGTAKRQSYMYICSDIEGVGGIFNAGTNKELTVYWTKVGQPYFPLAVEVLGDMILNSKFDPAEIERERQVIIEEINMVKDAPSHLVNLLIDEILWPGHPLGRDTAGSKESVTAMSRETILEYIGRDYIPNNSVVSIAGNIEHEEAVRIVSQATAGWKTRTPRPAFHPYEEQPNPRLRIEKKETEQAHLCLAMPGLSLLDSRRYSLGLLNVILGEGMSSRLFTEIRDKRGLAYSIHSYVDHFLDSGSVTVYAGVEPKNVPVAIEAILEQLALMKKPVPEPELSRAKEMSKGRMLLRMEDTRDVAGWIGGQEILADRVLTVDQVVSIIDSITADEVRKVAEELLVSEHLRLAVVGPLADGEALGNLLKL
ncbi:MAG: insulinase family protein [Chloroflexi bacterium]|nr:insulinase family protein [Chloroflexota bacterium]